MSSSARRKLLDDVRDVLAAHLVIPIPAMDVDETTHLFRDLELDSVQQLTLVVELENRFQMCFDQGEEAGIQTIGDVVALLDRRLGRS